MANYTKRKLKDNEYYNKTSKRYEFHYVDKLGKKRVISSAKLEANDQLPKSKNQNVKSLREKEAEVLKFLNANVDVDAGKITVLECAYKYLEVLYSKKQVAYNTKVSYTRICKTLSETELGQLPIHSVKVEDCDKWFVEMRKRYKGSAMQTDLSLVKRVLTVDKSDSRTRNPLTFETMQKFLDFVYTDKHSHHCWQLIHVLFWTGMRASEICGLTIADLDFEKRLIYVNKQVSGLSRE